MAARAKTANSEAPAPGLPQLPVPLREYQRRRRQLMELCGDEGAVIVPSAPERIRNNDAHYPYRQDSDLVYLTGFEEPEAVLVLVPGRKAAASIL